METIDYVSSDNFDIEGLLTLGEYEITYVYNKWKGESKLKINGRQNWQDIDDICNKYSITTDELADILIISFNNEYLNFDSFNSRMLKCGKF